MALTQLTADVENISKLDNYPPDDVGMTSAILKSRFDKGSVDIKAFINGTLIPQLDIELADKLSETTLDSAILTALSEAKDSGEFDGKDGVTIVNDLSEGGTTSALSAEMGKSLGTAISALTMQLNNELLGSINIKDYGAIGDGITDDTAAIQTALNSLSSDGGSLFIPTGVYMVSGLRLTRKTRAFIHGEGYGSVLKLKDGSNTDLLFCTWCDRAIFRDFCLDGNRAHNKAGHCIVLTDNSAYACIEEMEIRSAAENGIYILGRFDPENPTNYLYVDEVHINQSFVYWCGKSGLCMDGTGGVMASNNEFEYNDDHGICTTYIGISGSNGHILTGNNILSNKKCGIHLYMSSRVTISENVFCFNSDNGVYTEGGGSNWICNNQFEDNGQIVHGGQIKSCYQMDLWILNNIMTNAGVESEGAWQGIQAWSSGTIYMLGNMVTNHQYGSTNINDTIFVALFNQGILDSMPALSAAIHSGTVLSNVLSVTLNGYKVGQIYFVSLASAITAVCTVSVNGGTAYSLVDKAGTAVSSLAANSVIQIYQATPVSNFQIV